MSGDRRFRPQRSLSGMGQPHKTCQYIAADDGFDALRRIGQLFCGEACKEGSSYCKAHHKKLWVKPSMPIERFVGLLLK